MVEDRQAVQDWMWRNRSAAAAAFAAAGLCSVTVCGAACWLWRGDGAGGGWRREVLRTPGRARKRRAEVCRTEHAVDLSQGVTVAHAQAVTELTGQPCATVKRLDEGLFFVSVMAGPILGFDPAGRDGTLHPESDVLTALEELTGAGMVVGGVAAEWFGGCRGCMVHGVRERQPTLLEV